MIRWPFRHKGDPCDRDSKELAKQQLEVAKALQESARELAHEHRVIQYANHFGPSAAAALREGPR